jgi:hypothetical protein
LLLHSGREAEPSWRPSASGAQAPHVEQQAFELVEDGAAAATSHHVGATPESGGKKGDIVIELDAGWGRRGRIAIDAKDEAPRTGWRLNAAPERDAGFAILLVA